MTGAIGHVQLPWATGIDEIRVLIEPLVGCQAKADLSGQAVTGILK